MVDDGDGAREEGHDGLSGADSDDPEADGSASVESARRRTPRETVDELAEEDLTDLDAVEGIHVDSPEATVERGSIDRENALFVVLGVILSILVFLEFLSVLPAG